MIGNQLKLAWRNLMRNRFFSILNILGLGLGMACSLLILLWIKDERSMNVSYHSIKTARANPVAALRGE